MPKPGSTASFHRFSAPLTVPYPRAEPAGGQTNEDRAKEAEELRTARKYQFTAYDIASGLVLVSRGISYAQAGHDVRERAARRWGPAVAGDAARRHGTLVSDWVEVYAEALWRAQAPCQEAWPDTVLVGVLPLLAPGPGGRGGAPALAFSVFVALTHRPRGRPAIFAIRLSTGTGAAHWASFLEELDRERTGAPTRVVGDGSPALATAVRQVWPAEGGADTARPVLWYDEHLLREEARRICRRHGLDRREGRLWQTLQRGWRGRADWDAFASEARRHAVPDLDRWLALAGPVMERQLAARDRGRPVSRRPVRAALAELERRLGARRAAFGNRARTERLLRLMALDVSGVARVHAWADLICVWLERSGGRPASSQRRIADRGGRSSLRSRADVGGSPDHRAP
ncbi:hypothetical protein [Streptomyces fuscigenes]|uniref:hypothetical protein n=1 Tax=Streptomyces fuscigenes TaxID=1528880 RepID=UPI001F1D460E|nr:hypothetical protein [Streptomyces fuscigenes]MCF3961708.1 hypothetical protein [Streptomyces fuscigenes]